MKGRQTRQTEGGQAIHEAQRDMTNPLGLAKRCLLGDGLIVPVEDADEADDADEESSS